MKKLLIFFSALLFLLLQFAITFGKSPDYKEYENSVFDKIPFEITDAISFSSYGNNLGVSIHSSIKNRNIKYLLLTENVSKSKRRLLDIRNVNYDELKKYPMVNYTCINLKNREERVVAIHYFVEEMVGRGMPVSDVPQKAWVVDQGNKKFVELTVTDVNCIVFVEESP